MTNSEIDEQPSYRKGEIKCCLIYSVIKTVARIQEHIFVIAK